MNGSDVIKKAEGNSCDFRAISWEVKGMISGLSVEGLQGKLKTRTITSRK